MSTTLESERDQKVKSRRVSYRYRSIIKRYSTPFYEITYPTLEIRYAPLIAKVTHPGVLYVLTRTARTIFSTLKYGIFLI